jgi:hypothetical protein
MYKEVPPLSTLPASAGDEIVLNAALNSKVRFQKRQGGLDWLRCGCAAEKVVQQPARYRQVQAPTQELVQRAAAQQRAFTTNTLHPHLAYSINICGTCSLPLSEPLLAPPLTPILSPYCPMQPSHSFRPSSLNSPSLTARGPLPLTSWATEPSAPCS